MAINFTRLFTGLGKLFGGANEINTYRGTTIPTRVTTIIGQLDDATDDILTDVYTAKQAAKDAEDQYMTYLSTLTASLIVAEVKLDRPLIGDSITSALPELVRQMEVSSQTLNDSPSTLTVAAVGVPTAVGYQFVTNDKDGSGLAQDLIVPDVYLIQTTSDKDHGGVRWAETLTLTGKPADTDVTDDTYPSGTSISTQINVADPAASTGLTADSDFDNWTVTNTPDDWTFGTGTVAGTHVFKAIDDPRDGSSGFALHLVGDGAVIPKLYQVISVAANTTYAVHFRIKKINDPGTDWAVSVRLTDSTGAQLNGDNSYSNVKASDAATTVAADWTNVYTHTFITPSTLPADGVVRVEIVFHQSGSITTAPAATAAVYVDWVDVREHTVLYTGGPGMTVYSGTTASVKDDTWTLTVALTAGTISTFLVRWMDRMLDLKSYAPLRIPTVAGGGETQADSLIS